MNLMFREQTMKPRTPTALFTGTIILAVVCAVWLASLSCRPSADKSPRPAFQAPGIVPKA